ncbi:hypothetical protein H4219_005752 [Mycoemilia scoparia]|uniref:Mediator of RNA polymerase II transcription subunit 1 n=1 Tax=Mycoemilia scoparia TaxID=417184 RepID=A0A9W8DNN4_9FUNG|nr:hypothetical protein H4219_005752 [Mycoemilia scoparia]
MSSLSQNPSTVSTVAFDSSNSSTQMSIEHQSSSLSNSNNSVSKPSGLPTSIVVPQDVSFGLKLLEKRIRQLQQNLGQNQDGITDFNTFGSIDYSRLRRELNLMINCTIQGVQNYRSKVLDGYQDMLSLSQGQEQQQTPEDSKQRGDLEKQIRKSSTMFKELGGMRNRLGGMIDDMQECRSKMHKVINEDENSNKDNQIDTKSILGNGSGNSEDPCSYIVKNLERIANELGLVSYVDTSKLDTMATNSSGSGGSGGETKRITSVTICGDIIVLDVDIDSKGCVQKVKLSFASEAQHDHAADQLFEKTVKHLDFVKLKNYLAVLSTFDKLNKKFKPIDFFHATNVLTNSLEGISELELMNIAAKSGESSGLLGLLERGTGIPISYFNRPGPQILFYLPKPIISGLKRNSGGVDLKKLMRQIGATTKTSDGDGQDNVRLVQNIAKLGIFAWITWEPYLPTTKNHVSNSNNDNNAGSNTTVGAPLSTSSSPQPKNTKKPLQIFLPLPYKTFVVKDVSTFPNFSKLHMFEEKHPTIENLTIKYIEQQPIVESNSDSAMDIDKESPTQKGGIEDEYSGSLSSRFTKSEIASLLTTPYISVLRFDKSIRVCGATVSAIKDILRGSQRAEGTFNSSSMDVAVGNNTKAKEEKAQDTNKPHPQQQQGPYQGMSQLAGSLEEYLGYQLYQDTIHSSSPEVPKTQFNLLSEFTPSFAISRIPFYHPRLILSVIACLRRQLLFNELISSIFSSSSEPVIRSNCVVDVNILANQFSITLAISTSTGHVEPNSSDQMDIDDDADNNNNNNNNDSKTILEIVVQKNSHISITGHQKLENIINQCGNIPMTLAFL